MHFVEQIWKAYRKKYKPTWSISSWGLEKYLTDLVRLSLLRTTGPRHVKWLITPYINLEMNRVNGLIWPIFPLHLWLTHEYSLYFNGWCYLLMRSQSSAGLFLHQTAWTGLLSIQLQCNLYCCSIVAGETHFPLHYCTARDCCLTRQNLQCAL